MTNFENLVNLIKYPLITEKAMNLYNNQQYTFIVSRELTKIQIKLIFEKIFNIKISDVNTSILPTKKKRVGHFLGQKTIYKKAYITLKKGYTISALLY